MENIPVSENDLTNVKFWEERYGPSKQVAPAPWRSRSDYATAKLLARYVAEPGNRILEMGCGDSYWLSYFSRNLGLKVSGIDYSPQRSSRISKLLQRQGVTAEIRCGDFREIPADWKGQFDFVFSAGVVEHFGDPAGILRTFAQYLKADGMILTTVPNLAGLWGKVQVVLDREIYAAHNIFDLDALRRFHEEAGFQVLRGLHQRWADPSILNYAKLSRLIRRAIGASAYFLNLPLRALDALDWVPFWERTLSAGLAVVAKRHQ